MGTARLLAHSLFLSVQSMDSLEHAFVVLQGRGHCQTLTPTTVRMAWPLEHIDGDAQNQPQGTSP